MSLSKFSHRAWEPVLRNLQKSNYTSYSNQIRENVLEIVKKYTILSEKIKISTPFMDVVIISVNWLREMAAESGQIGCENGCGY